MARIRILAATDLNKVDPVLDHALLIADALGGEVVLLHALSIGCEDGPASYARAVATCETASKRSPLISKLAILRFEDAVDLICLSAEELDATVVVLGAESGPGSIIRGAVRECGRPLWLARGRAVVQRIGGPSDLPLLEHLRLGLAVTRSDTEHQPGDLKVVDARGLPALSRIDRVMSACHRGDGPVLVFPPVRSPSSPEQETTVNIGSIR